MSHVGIAPGPGHALRSREALREGVSRRQLEGIEFRRVRRGIYVPSSADLDDPDVRIQVAATALGLQGVLGGWGAARLYEEAACLSRGDAGGFRAFDGRVPWPEGRGEPEPLLMCMNRDAKFEPHPGARTLRSDLTEDERTVLAGIPVTSPNRTAFDLARLRSPISGLVAIDRLAHLRLIDLADFRDYVESMGRRRGAPQVRRLARLADARAESPPETVLRMIWREAGLPAPEVNASVYDGSGHFVARVDLLDREALLVVEYDGAHHSSAAQRSRDAARELELEALGYMVLKVTAADLASEDARRELRTRLARARRRALYRRR